MKGSSVAAAQDAVDAAIANFPIVKAVSPKSGAGPDLVRSGVPVDFEITGRFVGAPGVEADVIDGLKIEFGSWCSPEANAEGFSGVLIKRAGRDGEVVVKP